MKNPLTLDFETYYDSKTYTLKRMGPVEYVRDSRFVPLLLGLSMDGVTAAIEDREQMKALLSKEADRPMVGHNISGFDGLIVSERLGVRPTTLWDTISMAHWTGLSRIGSVSHENLTKTLGNGVKLQGTLVSDGKRREDFTPEEWDFFKGYCLDDAKQCEANFRRMLPFMTEDAMRFMAVTARMATDPMFEVDGELVRQFLEERRAMKAKAMKDLARILHVPDSVEGMQSFVRSSDALAKTLRLFGVEPPMKVSEAKTQTRRAAVSKRLELLRAGGNEEEVRRLEEEMDRPVMTYAFSKTDMDFQSLLEHPDPRVRLLVETRLSYNTSMAESRGETLLKFAGRRLPVVLCAFKAHTSRYTAGADEGRTDGVQVQNLSKRNPADKLLRQAIKAPQGHKVVACDSSQIEARCLAYLADERRLVEQFKEGRDPYSELAEAIFGVDHREIHDGAKSGDPTLKRYRNVGKTAVLSAGYGVGLVKFTKTLALQGARLSDDWVEHARLAGVAHSTYRELHPSIVRFWRTCDLVVSDLCAGGSGTFGGPFGTTFEYGSLPICDIGLSVPSIRLPSGFVLRYPDLGYTMMDGKPKYSFLQGKKRVGLWGGLMTNNVTQGFAFQILMWQACRMSEDGVAIHANIHDSFASVVPEGDVSRTAGLMEKWMSAIPDWAEGCPIACELEVGDDFTVV